MGVLAAVLLSPGCEESASKFGLGLDLQLRVHEAQLMQGGLPPDEGGPAVTQILRPQPAVVRGEATVRLSGRMGPGGVSLLMRAAGDADHWQVAPDGFDFVVADELLWGTELEFSHAVGPDELTVELQAVDAQGRAGPLSQTRFVMSDETPASRLLVSLGWDAPVDLDLHVELPDGTVVGAKNVNAFEPTPGVNPPADGAMLGGYHDYDSNQQCRLDLRNRENVVWQVDPPPGRYRVFAELFSACDAASVNLQAMVQLGEDPIETAGATMYAFDAREHSTADEAPGLLVLEFEVE